MKNIIIPLLLFFLFSSLNMKKSKTQSFDIVGYWYQNSKPVNITVSKGKVSAVTYLSGTEKVPDYYIAPGFIDNQVNGFAGVSFSFGGSDLTMEGIEKATYELWKKGVTAYLPTLTTNSRELLVNNLAILAESINNQNIRGSIPGFHLEGPYINPHDGFRGAHPKEFVRLPDWEEFLELYEAAGKHILQITVAPEIKGALDFISKCAAKGIVVAVGHHNADKEILDMAVSKGAKISTHLGNGCANIINRHHNPLWPQLANDNLMISIICDGFHLLPEEIKTFYKIKGPEKTIITSDVTSYAALEPGEYTTGTGEIIELTDDGMLRYPAQNVLYGSASPITKGIGHIMEVTGCTLGEAVQMASTNPAKLYDLNDRGLLEPGKRADIVLFTLENYNLKIQQTWVNGKLVYEK